MEEVEPVDMSVIEGAGCDNKTARYELFAIITHQVIPPASPLYLRCISPTSPPHLPSRSPMPPPSRVVSCK